MLRSSLWLLLPIWLCAVPAEAQTFTPGTWRIIYDVAGGPMGAHHNDEAVCFSPAEIVADPAAPIKRPPHEGAPDKAPPCDFVDFVMHAGVVSYRAQCKRPMPTIKAKWVGNYTPTSFAVAGKISAGFFTLHTMTSGQFLGACASKGK